MATPTGVPPSSSSSSHTAPPPPDGQVLSLVSALSSVQNHELHVQAIRARDEALSSSPETYSNLCLQMSCVLAGTDRPSEMLQRMDPAHVEQFRQTDPANAANLQQNAHLWTHFGQLAGLILKEALLHPPILQTQQRVLNVISPAADHLKNVLLYSLGCVHEELRNVASTIIATTAVSADSVQPQLSLPAWPQLIPTLLGNLQQSSNVPLVEGSLSTIRKMMEDGPHELRQDQLDSLVPVLLRFLSATDERTKLNALQSLEACLSEGLMPSALVALFDSYLGSLSGLATDPSPAVRKWVCRSIVTLLQNRSEYLQPHMEAICQFMLKSTADIANADVALEACEFWFSFASLDEDACTADMVVHVGSVLEQLVPTLLRCMVYLPEQQQELLYRNQLDLEAANNGGGDRNMKPVFRKTKLKGGADDGDNGDSDDGDDDDDDDADIDDDENNSWTLRKCAAASLDCLGGVYGPDGILPPLLPGLQEGLASNDVWVREASVLALGAVATGCADAMAAHMGELYPYLMNHLSAPESTESLPQLKSIAAWTIGRYASWAVDQVQSGVQGHLLAQMAEVFLARLHDKNPKVLVACCSAFGVVLEAAGDLMVPYLEPILTGLASALTRLQGRPLLVLFDVIGTAADFSGAAIGEGNLPSIFVPTMLKMWDDLAKVDPTDRTLVPLIESLASVAMVCASNFQPYALQAFESAMCMIETVTLSLATTGEPIDSEEDVDPIVCSADVIDGLVEGLGSNFGALLAGSTRYGPLFLNALVALTQHEVAGVRMSAFAIVGDLARHSPSTMESALSQILHECTNNIDPIQPLVCNNSVWAIGEICLKCSGNPAPLEPIASDLTQRLVAILAGNDPNSGNTELQGVAENAATTTGRLALAKPAFVANDLPRLLTGWCDGMAKIADTNERRDAFRGFIQTVYANPNAIQQTSVSPADAIASILFAVISWHMPEEYVVGTPIHQVQFQPMPPYEEELGRALQKLLQDIKTSVGDPTWASVEKNVPVNVRQFLREAYALQ